jgi:hypothetical protein
MEADMTPIEIEQAVFDLEEIRIMIRAPANAKLGDYQYARKAAGNASVSEWLEQRIYPITGDHPVVVVDGRGQIVHGRLHMENLRASYGH